VRTDDSISAEDYFWNVYQMPSGFWAGSVAGVIVDGYASREAVLVRVVKELYKFIRTLWTEQEQTERVVKAWAQIEDAMVQCGMCTAYDLATLAALAAQCGAEPEVGYILDAIAEALEEAEGE